MALWPQFGQVIVHSVIMAPMGPTRWGPRSEEWCIHLSYPMDDPRSLDDQTVMEDLHATLGVAKLDCTMHVVRAPTCTFSLAVASRLQSSEGRAETGA